MTKHALLSPSSAHRWLNCTKAPQLEQEFKDSSSEAAAEGSAAHALAEHELKKAFGLKSVKPVSKYETEEMARHVGDFVTFVLEQMASLKDPKVLIEQRLDFSSYVPEAFGTGDVVIVSDSTLQVIDLKYGFMPVEAVDNPQMKLYALGALELFDHLYDIQKVKMTIFQPRLEKIDSCTLEIKELYLWADEVLRPKARLAFKGEGNFCPGEWCRFCRAAMKCRARAEQSLGLAKHEFAMPPILTDGDIEEILTQIDDLVAWANDIKTYALVAAVNQGKKWTGFKLVESRSNRKYSDEDVVAMAAKEAGFDEIYRQSLIPLTEMERLMGKAKFQEIVGDLIVKPSGKPTLVPESDKRPEINQLQEFEEEL